MIPRPVVARAARMRWRKVPWNDVTERLGYSWRALLNAGARYRIPFPYRYRRAA